MTAKVGSFKVMDEHFLFFLSIWRIFEVLKIKIKSPILKSVWVVVVFMQCIESLSDIFPGIVIIVYKPTIKPDN